MINIGYACLAVAVPGSGMKSCTLKNAQPDRLYEIIEYNLNALQRLIEYNIRERILLFRISSDLIPFGSSVAAQLPWRIQFEEKLNEIGSLIKASGMRVSMHPGQYTVLNSPDQGVAERSAADLAYHNDVLDALGVGPECKIILHLGGVYGDKESAVQRFLSRYQELAPGIKKRLVLENDDRLFNIEDILKAAKLGGFPVVFDNLHHAVNPPLAQESELFWIRASSSTWKKEDGPQKIHYSQQDPSKRIGAHSESIRMEPFLDFYRKLGNLELDIMLEVKDKNISAVKCRNIVQPGKIGALEEEWSRYKYLVLEHSPANYQAIRKLLKAKDSYPAEEFYRLTEEALASPEIPGQAVNAASHVWGYFKNRASEAEKRRFESLLASVPAGKTDLKLVKKSLLRLAEKYQEDYLLKGYYFYR